MSGFVSIVQKYNLIKGIPILKGLGWYNLQKIARRVRLIEFKKGEIIRKEGDPADGFYCLVSGRVQAFTTTGGKKTDVEFIHRGMHFGIISLLTGENHSSTFEALNDSLVVKIDKPDFDEILAEMPQLGVELSHSLSRRLRSKTIPGKPAFESKIISIYSPVMGTGSSTYALNLALNLERETRRKVILVNISSALRPDVAPKTLAEQAAPYWQQERINVKDIVDEYDRIHQSIVRYHLPVDLLNVEFDPGEGAMVEKISHFVTTLAYDYHFVVVDLPTEMDAVVMKTLTQSDLVQFLTMDLPDALKVIRQTISDLAEALKERFNPDKVQVIVSAKDGGRGLSLVAINQEIDFTVYARLPNIAKEEMAVPVKSEVVSVMLPTQDCAYSREVRKIARRLSGVSVGLVLGGGAALGIAHIGVLRVLEEEKVPVDILVGSSMGALLGAFWAVGRNSVELEKLAREFDDFWKMVHLLCDPILPWKGLVGGKNIERWLRSRDLDQKTFYDTRIPLKIVAYDLMRREELVIDSGYLIDAIRQSIAIPGVIKSIRQNERIIIDGGVMNPLPTNVLVQSGVKKIIAVNVLQSPQDVVKGYEEEQRELAREENVVFRKQPLKYIGVRIDRFFRRIVVANIADIVVRSLQASEYLLAVQSSHHADIVIHPDLSGIQWFELYRVDELIKRGEDAARAALPEIKKLLAE